MTTSDLAPSVSISAVRNRKSASPVTHIPLPSRSYVLDTNVLLHDPRSITRFEERDLWIPTVVLEELDRKKKGLTDVARNAREVTRMLASLLESGGLREGFPLGTIPGSKASGRLRFIDCRGFATANGASASADDQILAAAKSVSKAGAEAILVTNDINLRVKALAASTPAQGYRSDRAVEDADILPAGFTTVNESVWASEGATSWREGQQTCAYWPLGLEPNTYAVEERDSGQKRLWLVLDRAQTRPVGSTLVQLPSKCADCGNFKPRNAEQSLAQHMLFREDLDLVSLLGIAGTGKTLLAVAAGLQQVSRGRFDNVLITRATVPMGDDIGFLPGSEQEKMDPWLGGILKDVYAALELPADAKERDLVEISSMSFMRGRSFHRKFIVIDEAQNLTVQQVRTLLTRAGDGSKVVLTGNLAQIDTPYVDAGNSGLTWAVTQTRKWPFSGHLILQQSERSRLAAFIEQART